MEIVETVCCRAPINIALVKYWGKRNYQLNLPLNSSLSATISMDFIFTETKVSLIKSDSSNNITKDSIKLNGNFLDDNKSSKHLQLFDLARQMTEYKRLNSYKIYVESSNTFPTSAGLASSASGFCCLVFCLAKLFKLSENQSYILSRIGSGSSCRSFIGGFVVWDMGVKEDGSDSIPRQVFNENHWPELCVAVLCFTDKSKDVSSTKGMVNSTSSSEFLKFRTKFIVDQHINELVKSIEVKDFDSFVDIVIKESNQLHAVCLDSYPPICPPYMNDCSWKVVELILKHNEAKKTYAYSFDAGPNCFIFFLEKDIGNFFSLVYENFEVGELKVSKDMKMHDTGFQYVKSESLGNIRLSNVFINKVGSGAQSV